MTTEAPSIELKPITQEQMQQKIAQRKATPPDNNGEQPNLKKEEKAEGKVETKKPEIKIEGEKGKDEQKGASEVKDEGAKEGEKPKRKSLKEATKPFSIAKEAPDEVKEDEIPEPIKKKIAQYEQEIQELKSKFNDEDYQFTQEIKKSDGSVLNAILKESNVKDISKLSAEQIFEEELRNSGVKPAEELDQNSTESSLEDEMEKFKALPKTARDREIQTIKDRLQSEQAGKTGSIFNRLKESNLKKDAIANAQRQKEIQASLKTEKDYLAICDASIGKQHNLTTITPQMAESLKNIIKDPDALIRKNEDGSLNVEDLFDLANYKLFKDLMLENMENHFFSEGFNELEKDVNVTKGASVSIVRTPQGLNEGKSTKEIVDYTMNTLRPVN